MPITLPDPPKRRVRVSRKNNEATLVDQAYQEGILEGGKIQRVLSEKEAETQRQFALDNLAATHRDEVTRLTTVAAEANERTNEFRQEAINLRGELDRERRAWRQRPSPLDSPKLRELETEDKDDWVAALPESDWENENVANDRADTDPLVLPNPESLAEGAANSPPSRRRRRSGPRTSMSTRGLRSS